MNTIEVMTPIGQPIKLALEAVLSAVQLSGCTVLPYPINYPTIEVRDGRPRLPSLPENPDAEAHGGRVGFYRLEAAQKLALADWYEKKAERDMKDAAKMVRDADIHGFGIDGKTAAALVNMGWHK